ncbi:hypothetical protein [Fervidibacter sacchari]|jgi:hypothetical protein|uniref:ABC transporter permease n=1 Tax=Candidatus Fervidibacter sacchari TaxID=1448929 RepID=A0ABT2EQ60_9BACT|nr:hypothetical protein [Candidatus Fervidibacter sacchari]MCS3919586.1 hypothetical protein [Candidatus Fervidibacter sacchari]WKU15309.1 hypothetical protein Q2T83_13330 [Candidatus Fervidibacter sacchari]
MSITAHPSDKFRHFGKEILALAFRKGNRLSKALWFQSVAMASIGMMLGSLIFATTGHEALGRKSEGSLPDEPKFLPAVRRSWQNLDG